MEDLEIQSPKRNDGSFTLFRVGRGIEENEGKFVLSMVCPQTSEGAMMVINRAQAAELKTYIGFLLTTPT